MNPWLSNLTRVIDRLQDLTDTDNRFMIHETFRQHCTCQIISISWSVLFEAACIPDKFHLHDIYRICRVGPVWTQLLRTRFPIGICMIQLLGEPSSGWLPRPALQHRCKNRRGRIWMESCNLHDQGRVLRWMCTINRHILYSKLISGAQHFIVHSPKRVNKINV